MPDKSSCLVAYIPVIHRGYLELFQRHLGTDILYIVGGKLLEEVGYKEKEIRALDPVVTAHLISAFFQSSGAISNTRVLTPRIARELKGIIVASEDEVTKAVAELYWKGVQVEWDTAFLRWDTQKVFSQQPVAANSTIREEDLNFMLVAEEAAKGSSDWWRRVGAAAVKDGKVVLLTYNKHEPSEHTPYAVGDPRDFVKAGQHSELCSSLHSEQGIVAGAAKSFLQGTNVYVTTFPCPVCAKLLAHAGITKLFFRSGHASLDGETVLRAHGVEIIQIT